MRLLKINCQHFLASVKTILLIFRHSFHHIIFLTTGIFDFPKKKNGKHGFFHHFCTHELVISMCSVHNKSIHSCDIQTQTYLCRLSAINSLNIQENNRDLFNKLLTKFMNHVITKSILTKKNVCKSSELKCLCSILRHIWSNSVHFAMRWIFLMWTQLVWLNISSNQM